jgi:hypothetical protein
VQQGQSLLLVQRLTVPASQTCRGKRTASISAAGCRYLAFHSRGGNHCHLNFIGISKAQAAKAKHSILDAASKHGFSLTPMAAMDGLEGQQALKDMVKTGQYFQAFLPDGSRLVHAITRCFPTRLLTRHDVLPLAMSHMSEGLRMARLIFYLIEKTIRPEYAHHCKCDSNITEAYMCQRMNWAGCTGTSGTQSALAEMCCHRWLECQTALTGKPARCQVPKLKRRLPWRFNSSTLPFRRAIEVCVVMRAELVWLVRPAEASGTLRDVFAHSGGAACTGY